MARFLVGSVLFLSLAVMSGCMLDRSALGCAEGSDDSGRCVFASDGGTDAPDAYVPPDGRIPDAHMDPDAFVDPDASMMDAGPDAWVDPDGGPPDAGPPDGGPVDACVAVAESCNGRDDNCDGRIDEGTTCPLRITFSAATGDTGFFVRIAWNGPGGPEMADYYLSDDRCRRTGAVVTCGATMPELAAGRIIRMYPFDDDAHAPICTAITCPSLCGRTTCPGFPPDGTYSYALAYLTSPVLDGEVTLNPDPGSAIDGPMPGDSAWLEWRLP